MLPEKIPITGPNGLTFSQPVVYEHHIPKCPSCGRLGHDGDKCRFKENGRQKKKSAPNTSGTNVAKNVVEPR